MAKSKSRSKSCVMKCVKKKSKKKRSPNKYALFVKEHFNEVSGKTAADRMKNIAALWREQKAVYEKPRFRTDVLLTSGKCTKFLETYNRILSKSNDVGNRSLLLVAFRSGRTSQDRSVW